MSTSNRTGEGQPSAREKPRRPRTRKTAETAARKPARRPVPVLRIPRGLARKSPLNAALAYAKNGFYVAPVRSREKNPGSILGGSWNELTSRDPEQIGEWWERHPNADIALHVGRSGCVVFDLDTGSLADLPEPFRSALGEAAVQLTRTDGSDRGHYVFKVRRGEEYGNSAPRAFAPFGEVRGKNGVIIVQPSAHADGGEYRWSTPGGVPLLPKALAAELKAAVDYAEAVTDGEVESFLDEHAAIDRPHALDGVVENLRRDLDESRRSSRHEAFTTALVWAFEEARAGCYPAREARDRLAELHREAYSGPGRTPGRTEFAGMCRWAVGQALASDPAAVLVKVNRSVDDDTAAEEREFARELQRARVRERVRVTIATERAAAQMAEMSGSAVDGAEFLTTHAEVAADWGVGNRVLAARGEGTLIVGPQGVGKSTVAQQFAFRRIGVLEDDLFGFPVQADDRPVLYLAMDRPQQIARSMRRMVDLDDPDTLTLVRKQLVVWSGPLPFNPTDAPEQFADWVARVGNDPGFVVVDSYKDVAAGLSEDAVGSGLNSAMQRVLERGTGWLGLHHNRKANAQNPKPSKLDDVYGSAWLTAGVGSVISLWGSPGAATVELSHLKQPMETVGPLTVSHEHGTGASRSADPHTALAEMARIAADAGVTEQEAAQGLYGSTEKNDRSRARRALESLVRQGALEYEPGSKGGNGGGGSAARWRWTG